MPTMYKASLEFKPLEFVCDLDFGIWNLDFEPAKAYCSFSRGAKAILSFLAPLPWK